MGRLKKVKKVKKVRKIRKAKTFVPRTKSEVGSSRIEKMFGLVLSKFGIELEEQHQIGFKFFDFKVKDKDILIEFQGDYYHCSPKFYPNGPINNMQRKSIKNDKFKKKLAEANGYKLLYFWEDDFKNHKHLIFEKLKEEGLI